jgi:hypothetical protein
MPLVGALKDSECNAVPKCLVMRSMLHKLTLTPKQCAKFLETLPAAVPNSKHVHISSRVDAFCALYTRCVDIKNLLSSAEQASLRYADGRKIMVDGQGHISVQDHGIDGSEFPIINDGAEHVRLCDLPRLEDVKFKKFQEEAYLKTFDDKFVILNQSTKRFETIGARSDPPEGALMVDKSAPYGLYGLALLNQIEVLNVRLRLGRLRVWDITRMDETWLLPGKPHYRPEEAKERIENAQKDLRQQAGMVRGLGLRDDVTSHGNANRMVLNLAVFEDWMFTCVMMQVAQREPGAHFDEPQWSETAHLEARGAKWLVPPEWTSKTPDVGVFTVRYFLERDEYCDSEFRIAMGSKYCGW